MAHIRLSYRECSTGHAPHRISQAGFTNRISRGINRTVLNFGFSGSGHMDLGIGMWLRTLDAAVFIVDCNWNMQAEEVSRKAGPIVAQLRAAHPGTPIVLAEGTPDGTEWFYSTHREGLINAALRGVFERLQPHDANLHYVTGATRARGGVGGRRGVGRAFTAVNGGWWGPS